MTFVAGSDIFRILKNLKNMAATLMKRALSMASRCVIGNRVHMCASVDRCACAAVHLFACMHLHVCGGDKYTTMTCVVWKAVLLEYAACDAFLHGCTPHDVVFIVHLCVIVLLLCLLPRPQTVHTHGECHSASDDSDGD